MKMVGISFFCERQIQTILAKQYLGNLNSRKNKTGMIFHESLIVKMPLKIYMSIDNSILPYKFAV